jgi:hypothetical protein
MINWVDCVEFRPPDYLNVLIAFDDNKNNLVYCVGFFCSVENSYYMNLYPGTEKKRKKDKLEKILKPICWTELPYLEVKKND